MSDNPDLVCVAYITLKNGRKLYAHNYGLKAFCFVPKRPKEGADKPKVINKPSRKPKDEKPN